MTLIERVRAVESLNAANSGARRSSKLTVEELREDIRHITSLEALAGIMTQNPQRARNELRNACRQVLSERKWDSLSGAEKKALTDELVDVVFGMGPVEGLIDDESVTEIMVNGARSIFFERDGKLIESDLHFDSDEQVRVLIDRIIGPLGRRIDESSPMVNARLPQGHRVHAVIPPVALDGPHLTIRAFTRRVITLEEMMEKGSLDGSVRAFLGWLVTMRRNVVVSGGTGSGKTTLLNALSKLIPQDERIITIEDSAELKFHEHKHVVRMEARPRNAEGLGEITIRELVINSLRMRPDRIIVGECRGGEALDMLQAMNTGHDGSLTTLHANSPEDVIDRMITLVRYAVDLPVDAIEAQIGHGFHNIVQVARGSDGSRFISSIADVSYDRETRRCAVKRIYEREDHSLQGTWLERPRILDEILQGKEMNPVDRQEVKLWE